MSALIPPQAVEAERAVLGALLMDPRAVEVVMPILRESDFYAEANQLVFRACARLSEHHRPVDALTVADLLRRKDKLELVGGMPYLGGLASDYTSSANLAHYARMVREAAGQRALMAAARTLLERCAQPGDATVQELASSAEAEIAAIVGTGLKDLATLGDAVQRAAQRVEKAYRSGGILGATTGLKDLDERLGGLEAGDLVVLAARPSMGKTALALNIAEHVARTQGPVLVQSLEMSDEQIAMRQLADRAKVPMSKLRRGRVEEAEWPALVQAQADLEDLPLYLDDTPAVTVGHIQARARRIQRKGGLKLLVVDYLTLMQGAGDSRDERVGEIAAGLKRIAKEMQVPVLALAQLNRQCELRPDKRPVMADLRESGAIEQHADVIMFIYRDEVYNPETHDAGIAEVIVGKQRNGPTGTERLQFDGRLMRFNDLAHDPAAPEATPVKPHVEID